MYPSLQASELSNLGKRFVQASDITESDWRNSQEIQRTWDAAIVRVQKKNGAYLSATMDKLVTKHGNYVAAPTVIFMHGCYGIWEGSYHRINFLARSGFAVIAPVSFAREKYAQSCDATTNQGGLYRGTLAMRQYDAAYAIEQAAKLTWVDSNNLFLMGHSEGAIVSATLMPQPNKLKARVVEGWTCHAGWDEYRGINAAKQVPVLALVGKYDPWFQNEWTRGDCAPFIDQSNNSQSVVFKEDYLSRQHELLEDQNVKTTVLEFLRAHTH